ncbi:YfbU family protein [Photobacterium frigidiphilum]|nr:YfbU family protein [Photobacterium frigidiphilum]
MDLTVKDRLFLKNQYEILKMLQPDNADSYDEKLEILESGYSLFYKELDLSLSEDELSEENCRFVLNVLSLFEAIHFYTQEHPDDSEVIEHYRSQFAGFDGNNECRLMSFALFLVRTQHRFEHLDITEFNSHCEMYSTYLRMLDRKRTLNTNGSLSREQVIEILHA